MRAIYVALIGASLLVSASNVYASQIAFDSAGDSAYNNFNPNGTSYPNGGYGWGGAWQSNSALFVNVPGLTGPGNPQDTTPINSPKTPNGRAWGVPFFLAGGISWAARPLLGALAAGQTFSIDVDTRANVSSDGTDGQFLCLGGVATAADAFGLTLEANPGAFTDYRVAVNIPGSGGVRYATGVSLADSAIHVDVSVLKDSTIRMSIISLTGDGASSAITFNDSVPITTLTLLNEGNGYAPEDQLYFNNIQVTPEASGEILLAILGMMTFLRRVHGAQKPLR